MANGLILLPAALGTVAASSAQGDAAATNVADDQPAKVWRSTSNSGQFLTIDMGASGAALATALALVNVNFSNSTTIRLRASNSSSGAVTSSPSLDTGSVAAWIGSKPTLTGWVNAITFMTFANSTAYRWWRIDIADSSPPLTYHEVGRVMLGTVFQPVVNFDQNPGLSFESNDPQDRGDYNNLFTERRGNVGRRMDLTWSNLTEIEALTTAYQVCRLAGLGGDVLVSKDPAHTTLFPQLTMQAVFAQAPRLTGIPFNDATGRPMWALSASFVEKV